VSPITSPIRRRARGHRRARFGALVLASLAAIAVAALSSVTPAHGATMASFRMAHFSPDTPSVDVYLTGFSGEERLVLPALGYGQVSTYVSAPAGLYTLSVRPAGSATSTPAKVITSTDLGEGAAYTFAAMGLNADLKSVVIGDDLGAPPAGQSKIRVINAASRPSTASVVTDGGTTLAEDLAFGATTDYVTVPAGTWNLQLTGTGVDSTQRLTVAPGSVNSVVIVAGPDGAAELAQVVDATIGVLGTQEVRTDPVTGGVPTGGMNTGAGGLAAEATRTPLATFAVLLGIAAPAALLIASVTLAVRRRTDRRPQLVDG